MANNEDELNIPRNASEAVAQRQLEERLAFAAEVGKASDPVNTEATMGAIANIINERIGPQGDQLSYAQKLDQAPSEGLTFAAVFGGTPAMREKALDVLKADVDGMQAGTITQADQEVIQRADWDDDEIEVVEAERPEDEGMTIEEGIDSMLAGSDDDDDDSPNVVYGEGFKITAEDLHANAQKRHDALDAAAKSVETELFDEGDADAIRKNRADFIQSMMNNPPVLPEHVRDRLTQMQLGYKPYAGETSGVKIMMQNDVRPIRELINRKEGEKVLWSDLSPEAQQRLVDLLQAAADDLMTIFGVEPVVVEFDIMTQAEFEESEDAKAEAMQGGPFGESVQHFAEKPMSAGDRVLIALNAAAHDGTLLHMSFKAKGGISMAWHDE
jgi:hypothetical protein